MRFTWPREHKVKLLEEISSDDCNTASRVADKTIRWTRTASRRGAGAVVAPAFTSLAAVGALTSSGATLVTGTALRLGTRAARELSSRNFRGRTRCGTHRLRCDRGHGGARQGSANQAKCLPPRHGRREDASNLVKKFVHTFGISRTPFRCRRLADAIRRNGNVQLKTEM
jgi:hypothetical protein